jgi:hypothetical protein
MNGRCDDGAKLFFGKARVRRGAATAKLEPFHKKPSARSINARLRERSWLQGSGNCALRFSVGSPAE